jgi:hypothetical protein
MAVKLNSRLSAILHVFKDACEDTGAYEEAGHWNWVADIHLASICELKAKATVANRAIIRRIIR